MKRTNLISEIQSNIKQLTDSQLADVADYIEMIMGTSTNDISTEIDDSYDQEDYDYLEGEDTSYQDSYDDSNF